MTSRTTIACAMQTARSTATSTTSRRNRSPRAFSLIELLIVIALLLAVAALTLPGLTGVLDARAFDAAVDSISQQLILARAEAQSAGRAMEVVYQPDPPRVVVRPFEAAQRAASESEFRTARRRGEAEDGFDAAGEAADELAWNWAMIDLPDGVRMSVRPPANLFIEASAAGPVPVDMLAAAAEEDAQPPRPIRLAVFMADGSALLSRGAWLIGRARNDDEPPLAMRLEVNPWTGLAVWSRREASSSSAPAEEPDEDPLMTNTSEPSR
ncbi:MAG TPA: prepilin-type N-terminal cleavage/methylation domain-containing protein [Phycisphaerales bacterium]|nr:prepilin-type N-terminal cleavage/methylation domain-containing protein [Phycisphaerales bacterium]